MVKFSIRRAYLWELNVRSDSTSQRLTSVWFAFDSHCLSNQLLLLPKVVSIPLLMVFITDKVFHNTVGVIDLFSLVVIGTLLLDIIRGFWNRVWVGIACTRVLCWLGRHLLWSINRQFVALWLGQLLGWLLGNYCWRLGRFLWSGWKSGCCCCRVINEMVLNQMLDNSGA